MQNLDFYSSLMVLLQYTVAPGCLPWILDLVEDGEQRVKLEAFISTPSSLAHMCRVRIRDSIPYRYLSDPTRLTTAFDLPIMLCDYLLYR